MREKTGSKFKITILSFSIQFFLFSLGMGVALSQIKPKMEEKGPQIHMGGVAFQVREIETTLSPIKMVEVHVEIVNRSQQFAAPPNSIKVVLAPKDVKFPTATPVSGFNPVPEEITLDFPLSPRTGRVVMFGLSLPEIKPESITFEIQINPPDGEKKTVTWEEH
jgi:hypothetical protein